ncbi:MAG: hypothetical protein PHH37_08475 [Paludibacter sp.]|nr:hypothetical protein [Paludibacter sp.]
MNLQEIQKIKQHGDTSRIMRIANKIAEETGGKTYSETTVRQMLNGNRRIKPVVEQAASKYYELIQQTNKSVNL